MEWISPNQGNILSEIEGNIIEPIEIQINGSNNYEIIKVSGNFPNGISLVKEDNEYFLEGTLDLVSETTTYYFTLQAKDLDTNEIIQRWFSIEVITKVTSWNNDYDNPFEIIEKTYFSYQFNLINPEGNEIFKKITGELPNGLTLSETGLLYGVVEEDREDSYYFTIGVYRNDELLFSSPIIEIKTKDFSELNKPIWVTESGILEYIEYNKEKNISFLAYDPKGREITYHLIENNLPLGIEWTEETSKTGRLEGVCKTKTSYEWKFKVKPIINDNDEIIEGDVREFIIVTNAIESDNLITWISDELEPVKIGYNYDFNIVATSSKKITYNIDSGKLPLGLKMNNNGNICGTIDYQDLGNYSFTVRAYTSITFSQKTFTIEVIKGLSEDSLDVYLYINKDNYTDYKDMLMKYDRTSSYNQTNPLYRIPSEPRIDICTLNTWDNTLLKYKFGQFNTAIDIGWKETKKKSFDDYDFFYKNFNEVNRKSQFWDLKIHTDNETEMVDRYGNTSVPGYIRDVINEQDIKIEYYWLSDDKDPASPNHGSRIEDIENIRQEVNMLRTNYYYVDPEDPEREYLIHDPIYKPISNPKEVHDYVEFGQPYVVEKIGDIEDESKRIYIQKISIGRYYEKESKKIVNLNEPIYIDIEILETGEDVITKYITKETFNNETKKVEFEKIEVEVLNEDGYASFDPKGINDSYLVDTKKYNIIRYTSNINHYYHFNSPTIQYQTTSIEGLRNVFAQPFYVNKFEGKLWYKMANQQIIYKKNGDLQDYDFQRYILKKDEHDNYYVEFNGNIEYLYVYRKMDDGTYKQVFTKIDDNYEPLIQKANILDGNVDFVFYTIYRKGSSLPFKNALFICEWDESLKYTCEYDEEMGVYQWFRVDEIENPFVYYASKNQAYGYNKDIILPNIKEEHIVKNNDSDEYYGTVTFLDLENEFHTLPNYMKDNTIDTWKSETIYNVGDKVIYGDYIYSCLVKHTSKELFDESLWRNIGNAKTYTPTLPLYYSKPKTQDAILKNINAYEKEGNYWYGRKFVFFEVHFSPKYKNNIDNFTIPFYNDVNDNSPEFLLI